MTDFFTPQIAEVYDERNSKLAPIADNMHFLIRLVLKTLPQKARILCVGVGTGAEILSLAKEYPQWSFVGVDPSDSMLQVCHKRLVEEGIIARCTLMHGYVQDVLPPRADFDAVVSVLVGHFVKRGERAAFYGAMAERLKQGGFFVNTELSFDQNAPAFIPMLDSWKEVQKLMGATGESLKTLPEQLRNMLCVLPPEEVEELMIESGIDLPVRFFQAFMIAGWYGQKV